MIFFLWIVEFFCWLSNLFSNIFFFVDLDKKGKAKSKNPIVLVIGGFTGAVLYIPLKRYLEKKGLEVFIPHFSQEMGNLDTACDNLEKYFKSKEIKNATLVGISAGGLVCHLFLNNHEGWSRVEKFIALGTPFKGTWMALFTAATRAGRQLLPNSNFIQKVKNTKAKNLDKTFCIVAWKDELVPRRSSKLAGSKVFELKTVGHVRLHAFSKKTFEKIAEIARA